LLRIFRPCGDNYYSARTKAATASRSAQRVWILHFIFIDHCVAFT
jgi:hypothetical protein